MKFYRLVFEVGYIFGIGIPVGFQIWCLVVLMEKIMTRYTNRKNNHDNQYATWGVDFEGTCDQYVAHFTWFLALTMENRPQYTKFVGINFLHYQTMGGHGLDDHTISF